MTSYKLYKPLLLSLSLALTACGSDSDDDDTSEVTTPETTPGVTELSVANPIADITLIANVALDFSIPAGTCTAAEGVEVSQLITGVTNNVGFGITNFTAMSGLATEIGEVTVTVTCSTATEEVTDEFTITVVDFEADPVVEIKTPSFARANETFTLTALAQDQNFSGSIVSYAWVETSDLNIALTNADAATATFTTPDTTAQTTATFQVTVTDNDGDTAIETVEVDLISTLAPKVSLSFPLALGVYSAQTVDMFGTVEAATGTTITSVAVFVDDVEHNGNPAHNAWRVSDVTITDNSEIKVVATSSDGFINYEEITLVNDLYETTIDENISDIAVSESTGDIYVHSDGALISDLHITKFNLDTAENEELSYTKNTNYGNNVRTSIATDSDYLYLSAATAITKIDLSTNIETVFSDGAIDAASTDPQVIFDLGYNTISEELYFIDLNTQEVNTVDTSGFRTNSSPATGVQAVSVARAANGFTYYAQGQNTTGAVNIYAFTSHASAFEVIHSVDSPANGGNGGPVSDLALNEAVNELYFFDGAGDLIKLNLDTDPSLVTSSTVLEGLFTVESITGLDTPLIGLHYDTTRNVIIAAGRDADGTNKLLVIDPVSGDYAKVATGTVD